MALTRYLVLLLPSSSIRYFIPSRQNDQKKPAVFRKLTMAPEITITGFSTRDVRFPTSLDKTGSDAMNAAGDYSSAYCILETDSEYTGHGMVSTCPATSESRLFI